MNFKEDQTEQKLRGGYYTPSDLAEFLVRWVAEKSPASILEPSCGDGVFFKPLATVIPGAKVQAFELDEIEARSAAKCGREAGLSELTVTSGDFLGWALSALEIGTRQFDAVIGNPPFVRYQYLPEIFQ